MPAPTPSEAHKLFPDPGSANYFDLPRDPKHVIQKPMVTQSLYMDDTIRDLMSKVKAGKVSKRAFVESFAAGFAEKIASIPADARNDVLGSMYARGVEKAATGQNITGASNYGVPPAQSVPQQPIKQEFRLGSQFNMMGKKPAPIQGESVGKKSGTPGQQISLREPLKDFMQAPEKELGIEQLKPPAAFS